MKNIQSIIWYFIFFSLTLSIETHSEESTRKSTKKNFINESIVARVGDDHITLQELDNKLKLALYDLELAQYHTRLAKLTELIEKSNPENTKLVKVSLMLPEPPRILVPHRNRAVKGNLEAPINIAIFCSYQSPHCKAIQPALRKISKIYSGLINQSIYDFPLKFHRQGRAAALAVRCAEQQGALWPYQDGLYAYWNRLNGNIYKNLATQMELNIEEFEHCLSSKKFDSDIEKDIQFAMEIGMQKVPVVFINGLYIKGPKSFDYYNFWIEKELHQLKLAKYKRYPWVEVKKSNKQELLDTQLPLSLVGVSLSSHKEKSTALIEIKQEKAQSFRKGDEILTGVNLASITQYYVIIENNGSQEKLILSGNNSFHVPLTEELKKLHLIELPDKSWSKKMIEPSAILPLGKKWLENNLKNQAILNQKFTDSGVVLAGHSLMRLENIEDNEFFTGLGFVESDVLLRVNDKWVNSAQNSLWDALASGKDVDVFFMRNGLPQRLKYRFVE